MATVGILHPGAMGAALGGQLVAAGHRVCWASRHRSGATLARASQEGLTDESTVAQLANASEVIVSVCPPAFSREVADDVAASGFKGLYLDANAVAPSTAREIGAATAVEGATFVDGGIVGPPPRSSGSTMLFVSGSAAALGTITGLFDGTTIEVAEVGTEPGAASATKMAFAAWTKGSSALLLAVRALAEAEGVTEGLYHAWERFLPELPDRVAATTAGAAPKAWRFTGEMEEIAATFDAADLPDGFHLAAAEIYARMSDLRGTQSADEAEVLRHLLSG